jgi:hypothetical protein
MATCLFCNNRINSEEHLWPQWVHEREDFGPAKIERDGNETIIIPHPKITVRAVCRSCNGGWMSERLEVPNIPIIGSMMQDLSITLDREQQKQVATWCMKMAFLADFTRRGGKQHRFYSRPEALAFAADPTIPPNTRIWIGHITTSHLITDGHDFTRNLKDTTRIGISTAVTIGVGHFVAQIVTDHLLPDHTLPDPQLELRPGPWDTKLIQIWPIQRDWITWPPKASFTNGGPEGFAYFLRRWRTGKKGDKII